MRQFSSNHTASRASDVSSSISSVPSSISLGSSLSRFSAKKKVGPLGTHPTLPSSSVSRLSKQSSMSSSRRSKKKKKEDFARIIDELGRDVTPLPLTGVYATMGVGSLSLVGFKGEEDKGGGEGDRTSPQTNGELQRHGGSGVSSWSFHDDDDPYQPNPSPAGPSTTGEASTTPTVLTEISNQSPAFASITLSETPTMTLFHLPSLRFLTLVPPTSTSPAPPPTSTPYQTTYAAENERYTQLLLNKKDKDRYVTAFAQTLNASQRSRGVQVSERETVSEGVQASSWMMWESQRELEEEEGDEGGEAEGDGRTDDAGKPGNAEEDRKEDDALTQADQAGLTSPRGSGGGETSRSDASSSSSSQSSSALSGISTHTSTSSAIGGLSALGGAGAAGPTSPALVVSDSLMSVLKACEEAVLQNVHHHAQLLYRNLAPLNSRTLHPPSTAGGTTTSSDPLPNVPTILTSSLVHLFTFAFPLSLCPSSSPPLSCLAMSFNKANPDLLAVGYGSYSYRQALSPGMLLFWSFHNASFPHRGPPYLLVRVELGLQY